MGRSDRLRADGAAPDIERQYRLLFENMRDSFFLAEPICDEEGRPVDWRFLDANPAFAEMTGIPLERVIGRRNSELFPGAEPIWCEAVARVARTGEAEYLEAFSEVTGRWYSLRYYSPHPGLTAAIASDISERKQLETALRRTMGLLENVYATLDLGVLVLNSDDRAIISCNAAAERIFGYRQAEMLGRGTEFIHIDERTHRAFGRELAQALDAGGIFQVELNMRRKDGTVFTAEYTAKAVRDDSGRRTMIVGAVRDITEWKTTIAALNEKEKALKDKNERLEELNTALRVLIEQRDKDRKILEENLSENLSGLVLPYLDRMRKTRLNALQAEYLDVLESNLRQAVKSYHPKISEKLMRLSPTETMITGYVKQGYRSKEIAEILKISQRTVEFHRDNIRKKLGIKSRKANLRTFLSHAS